MSSPFTRGVRRSRRNRRATTHRGGWIAAAVVTGIVLCWLVASSITSNLLWFSSLHFQRVYLTRLLTGTGLFLAVGTLVWATTAGNMVLAMKLRPRTVAETNTEFARKYRAYLEKHHRAIIGICSGALALIIAATSVAQTTTVLAWWNATSFGARDPYFDKDISFYVFDYPWYKYLVSLGMALVITSVIAAFGVHLVMGSVNYLVPRSLVPGGLAQARRTEQHLLSARAQSHISVLLAIGLVFFGLSTILGRYGLAVSDNGLFTGVGFTADHYRATAKIVVAIIAFLVAALFVANAWWRRWGVPGMGIALMLVSTLIIQGIYPAVMQRFQVVPDAPDKERPYIVNNIAATRTAFGIQDTTITDYAARTTTSAGQLKTDAETLPAIRLMDPAVVAPTFEQLQQVRGFYSFPKILDVDRYTIDGKSTDVVVGAREIDQNGIADKSWNNVHTVYTHGYGMVAAAGGRRENSGEPTWLAKDIPTTGSIKENQSRVYYGEMADPWVVVGARDGAEPVELDTPGGGSAAAGTETMTTYAGHGGVAIGNPVLRTMYATQMADINLLLSDRVHSNSKILYDRKPRDRVAKVAPWLTVDSDSLPAVVDGRMVWIVDGYTTSSDYPNSTKVDLRDAASDSTTGNRVAQRGTEINYIRNSVKAVVDAYDGTVQLYAWQPDDPILQTWQKVYPGTVKPRSAMSKDLLAHVRYPQDLFKVQRAMLGQYHTTNPNTWYQHNDVWEAPDDPVRSDAGLEPPYYLTIRWPDDDDPQYSATAVMVPNKRQNLASYVSVGSDATKPGYGKIRVLRMSGTTQIAGPNQTASAITADENVSAKLLPYQNRGSASATHGNLLTLPVGGGLMYVQPIYAQRQTGSGGYPVLRFVAVRFGENVGIGDTLQEALDQVFGGDAGASTGETAVDMTDPDVPGQQGSSGSPSAAPQAPPSAAPSASSSPGARNGGAIPGVPSPNTSADASELLDQAQKAFVQADKALDEGNLGEYQKQVDQARTLVEQARKLPR